MSWREELDSILEARTYGKVAETLPLLIALDERHPNVAEINYQLAWTCDVLSRPADALPYYQKSVALGLPPNEHSGALIGFAATLRNLGQSAWAIEVLQSGKRQFPSNREFDAFLALALHDEKRHAEAIRMLTELLCETSEDPGITAYQRALRHAVAAIR
ncbi:MAG TPA: tetratricopeptide repeat protein [Candidatus Didemnitutus sp.]|jgi:tetratricopeptide (TPR) repeat protein